MKVVRSFPRRAVSLEHVPIAMPDGIRLSARIWLPEDAEARPVPAILEYIPYRKRDMTRPRDEPMHAWFAGHGYASVRLDLRGSGDSQGVLLDEYLPLEQDDAVAAIAWLAVQPWCTGAVGMMGKSWGAFNALQVAARRPPALQAVIAVCGTDDRYRDDVHWMGGCLLTDSIDWGAVFTTFLPRPPDPEVVGPAWRAMWEERLQAAVCPIETWLAHQRRDAYWRQGSVCEDYGAIACPVYLVDGWADAYRNFVLRLLEHLQVPRKGLIGPWAHLYPHDGRPGPAIGFLQEALRWWDRWLKGVENGIMAEPMLRAWMQESEPPRSAYDTRAGRWIAEAAWPAPSIRPSDFFLAPGGLVPTPPAAGEVIVPPAPACGAAGGDWGAFALPNEMAEDQRFDDALCAVFDSAPLPERVEIFGTPRLALTLSVDRPVAQLAVRLNDLRPDGAVVRVSFGLLNLCHRDSDERPTPLEPGRSYQIAMRLNDAGYAFPAGHRIRLAVSTGYWPIAWPSPEPVTAVLQLGEARLTLPLRPPSPADDRLPAFGEPESAPGPRLTALKASPPFRRSSEWDAGRRTLTRRLDGIGAFGSEGRNRFEETGMELEYRAQRSYEIQVDDPSSAVFAIDQTIAFARLEWQVELRSRTRFSATASHFVLDCHLEAFEQGAPSFHRRWRRRIARDLV